MIFFSFLWVSRSSWVVLCCTSFLDFEIISSFQLYFCCLCLGSFIDNYNEKLCLHLCVELFPICFSSSFTVLNYIFRSLAQFYLIFFLIYSEKHWSSFLRTHTNPFFSAPFTEDYVFSPMNVLHGCDKNGWVLHI